MSHQIKGLYISFPNYEFILVIWMCLLFIEVILYHMSFSFLAKYKNILIYLGYV